MRTLSPSTAPCLGSRPSSAANSSGSFLTQERSSGRNDTRDLSTVKSLQPAPFDFLKSREAKLQPLKVATKAWNESVAALVSQVGQEVGPLVTRRRGIAWNDRVVAALHDLQEPLRSDVILSTRTPMIANATVKGSVRAFCSAFLEQDLEFMPRTMEYPKFPYFTVEPATQKALFEAGLYLLANPPEVEADEPDATGSQINRDTYLKTPMISVELRLAELQQHEEAAVLLNWSCRGRAGAKAKIFINGQQDVPAFEVRSTEDDNVPNFWTFLPWTPGTVVVDLKHVGSGYLWFEHVDVHHIRWTN